MDERRQHPRHQPNTLIEASEQHSGRYLGRIADLSAEGFMLCCPEPQQADSLVSFRLSCQVAIDEAYDINLTADCLWARGGENGQQSWAGYHIIDIAQSDANHLDALLKHLQTIS